MRTLATKKKPVKTFLQEFSKGMVDFFKFVFCAHLLMTLVIIAVTEKGSETIELFSVCVPIYVTVFGGYYGKAAIENAKKIGNAAYETTNDTSLNG